VGHDPRGSILSGNREVQIEHDVIPYAHCAAVLDVGIERKAAVESAAASRATVSAMRSRW